MAENKKVYSIAIIGGGAAGTMAAASAVHHNDDVILFPGSPKNKKKSRAFWVSKIENMPGLLNFSKAIEQPNREMFKTLSESEFGDLLDLKKNRGVEKVEKNSKGLFELTDNKGESYLAKYVILTTGIMDVQPEISGSIAPIFPYANIQLVDYCLRCDGHHVIGKKTSVIGAGIAAPWVAIMLYERYQTPEMKVLTHGEEANFSDELWELLKMYNIEVITSKIVEVHGNPKEKSLEGYTLENGEFISTEFSFVSMGTIVYNELAVALGAAVDNRGYVITDSKGKTSVDGLFVAGDLRAGIKKQVYTAWDSAVDSANEINRLIRMEQRDLVVE